MRTFTKNDHIRAILELYKVGYITTMERDNFIAGVLKTHYDKAAKQLDISTKVEGRKVVYSYFHNTGRYNMHFVQLYVPGDFYIQFEYNNDSLIEIEF